MGSSNSAPRSAAAPNSRRFYREAPDEKVAVDPVIARAIAGTRGVSREQLRAKLGGTTYLVWTILCKHRDPKTGVTDLTRREIERQHGIKERTVQDCLKRLRRAGLVANKGWTGRWRVSATMLVYEHVVYGAPPMVLGSLCSVPAATIEWLEALPKRGGVRPGAGRPKQSNAPPAARKNSYSNAPPAVIKGTAGGYSNAPPTCFNRYRLGSSASPYGEAAAADGGALARGKPMPPSRRSPPVTPRLGDGLTHEERTRQYANLSPSQVAAGLVGLTPQAGGYTLGAPGPRKPLVLHPVAYGQPHPAVPPFVSLSAVCPVKIPHPPLLDPRDVPGRQAYLLQRWFEGAVESRTGKRCWSFKAERVGHITKSKHYPLMLQAIEMFAAHEIAPAAWCAFSTDVWIEHSGKKTAPPIDWTFAAKRIEERRGWFRSVATDFEGGRLIFTDKAKEFLRRQNIMRTRLRWLEMPAGDDDIRRIVETYFPDGLFERMLEEIKAESAELNRSLAEKVYLGEWVWT